MHERWKLEKHHLEAFNIEKLKKFKNIFFSIAHKHITNTVFSFSSYLAILIYSAHFAPLESVEKCAIYL